jgi:hypothetical protein
MNKTFTKTLLRTIMISGFIALNSLMAFSQQSVARQWNECQLNCIRKYFAKPTVHARHLFHCSVVMYDAWAVYDDEATPFFLGNTWGSFTCPFDGIPMPADGDLVAAQEKAISYAMYRTLWNRYTIFAPGANLLTIQGYINAQMTALGYDPAITSTDYSDGDPAKLGNYIAAKMQEFALQDGSNQQSNYANLYYQPINGQISPLLPGNPNVVDPNRWQALVLNQCIDQNGIPVECPPGTGAPALSHEWGNVVPFALTEDQSDVYERDGHDWKVYLDPGAPPYLDTTLQTGLDESFFKWGYVMNIIWHSFHDNDDGVMIDASPNNIGGLNITSADQLPHTFEEYQAFYDMFNGGVHDPGHDINPVTGEPYEVQMVPRSDFTRVLSQYWADGPASETPPGHWFKLFNEVADHPMLEKRWMGEGDVLSNLEWDVRGYFALGGGIHDAAVACWSAKGYYDYTRPIMAIRWMGTKGQSTDPMLPSYHPAGLPLIPGYIELVEEGDELAGANNEHVNKIKVFSWRGPFAGTGIDGAGWLLAENWWTYQTAGFVTPPFAGYYSGHSTYSRTGAEIMTLITGDEYFPGGYSEFVAEAGEYLIADEGPSVTVKLQWATYRDASDQCSVSRIYGGLHPPQDDIPGREVGMIVGPQCFNKANGLMTQDPPRVDEITFSSELINDAQAGSNWSVTIVFDEPMNPLVSPQLTFVGADASNTFIFDGGQWTSVDTYVADFMIADANVTIDDLHISVSGAQDMNGVNNIPGISAAFAVDTQNPTVVAYTGNGVPAVITDASVETPLQITLSFNFSEEMDPAFAPTVQFSSDDASASLQYDAGASSWSADNTTYHAVFSAIDVNEEFDNVDIESVSAVDVNGNEQVAYAIDNLLIIDTRNPLVQGISASELNITDADAGTELQLTIVFDEPMNINNTPMVNFPEGGVMSSLWFNESASGWQDDVTYSAVYFIADADVDVADVDVAEMGVQDTYGNPQVNYSVADLISIDTHNPNVLDVSTNFGVISDASVGNHLYLDFNFDDAMNTAVVPAIAFQEGDPLANSLTFDGSESVWIDADTYRAAYLIEDANEELLSIGVALTSSEDDAGNTQNDEFVGFDAFDIDTKNPTIITASANTYNVTSANQGANGFSILAIFSEVMDENSAPLITFPEEVPPLTANLAGSSWLSPTTYKACFDVPANLETLNDIDVEISADALDAAGNVCNSQVFADFFDINMVVSVEDVLAENAIVVYPNPIQAGQNINLQFEQQPAGLEVKLYNGVGQLISSTFNQSASGQRIEIGTADLGQGIYFVHVHSAMGSGVYPVSIVR